eukprot:759523-Hanusia_phi.AAC.3
MFRARCVFHSKSAGLHGNECEVVAGVPWRYREVGRDLSTQKGLKRKGATTYTGRGSLDILDPWVGG